MTRELEATEALKIINSREGKLDFVYHETTIKSLLSCET